MFAGMKNEAYIDDLAQKTHRGQEGRARKGWNTGGRAYGYRHVQIRDTANCDSYGNPNVIGARREIDSTQAKIIREIFTRFADGESPRAIASELNRRAVPSPAASWRRTAGASGKRTDGKWLYSCIYGDHRVGTGLLNNALYRGEQVWNRFEKVKVFDAEGSNARKAMRLRPESEWVRTAVPHLRIIDEALWLRVQRRQVEVRSAAAESVLAPTKAHGTGAASAYPLSGILRCKECGSRASVSGKPRRYTCSTHTNGGQHACANNRRESKDALERTFWADIKQALREPSLLKASSRRSRCRRHARASQVATMPRSAPVSSRSSTRKSRASWRRFGRWGCHPRSKLSYSGWRGKRRGYGRQLCHVTQLPKDLSPDWRSGSRASSRTSKPTRNARLTG
jgi:site-specific DNA recombinase